MPLQNIDELAATFAALSSYSALEEWKQQAKKEKGKLDQAAERINQQLQIPSQRIRDLSLELDRTKLAFKQQPLLKRMFGTNEAARTITAQVATVERERTSLLTKIDDLQETAANVQKLTSFAADFGPASPAEKAALIKKITLQKKELQVKKREASGAATAIRREAQARSNAAGRVGLFHIYDSETAAAQRRGIREAKENALRPYESEKAEIEEQLIKLEKHLLWIGQFDKP